MDGIYPADYFYGKKYLEDLRGKITKIGNSPEAKSTLGLHSEICKVFRSFRDLHLTSVALFPDGSIKACEKRSNERVGVNVAGKNAEKPTIGIVEAASKKILVLGMPSFEFTDSVFWEKYIEDFKNLKSEADGIIIDLRGNSGGTDEYPSRIVEILAGKGGEFLGSRDWVVPRDNEVIRALKLNQEYIGILNSKNPDQEAMNNWKVSRGSYKNKSVKFPLPKIEYFEEPASSEPRLGHWEKPIVILQDRNCASTCEYVLENLQAIPTAKSVGQNSAGAYHLVWAKSVFLSRVRLLFYIPTRATTDLSNKNVEGVGLDPKVFVPTGKDAFKVGVKILLEQLK